MALLVEIHVPIPEVGDPSVWIDAVEDFLVGLEDHGGFEVYDDGEQFGDVYVFFIAGGAEADLLSVASQVARLDGVPGGAFAMVTDDEAEEIGMGRRVSLPVAGRP
jgi:hypothetical protein